MRTQLFVPVFILSVFCSTFAGAQKKDTVDLQHLKFTVEEAKDWTAALKRDTGWFGGDGIFAIPLNGKEEKSPTAKSKNIIIFSDSMVGTITGDKLQPGYKMIHNSVAVFDGDSPKKSAFKFYWAKDKNDKPESIFIPKTPQTGPTDYFWLGDGFLNTANNSIYIFGFRVKNVSKEAMGFREVGNVLIKIPANEPPPYNHMQQEDTPLYATNDHGDVSSFGAGIYVNTKQAGAPNPDGYVYVYGVRDFAKNLMVARVLPADFDDFSKWRYWDGKEWNTEKTKVADITSHVSNELSVTALPDGRYALIFQQDGMSTTIGMRIGTSPKGPFGPIIKLWDCKDAITKKSIVVYNAKAHPSLSKPGELLISYNVNSLDFDNDLLQFDPHLYRPRFIRLKFQ